MMMQNLEKLALEGTALIPIFAGNKIQLKNVKDFRIYQLEINYPFRFEQLESFHFFALDRFPPNAYDFIAQHPTINELFIATLMKRGQLHEINVARLAQAVPMLLKIHISSRVKLKLSANDIVRFVSPFKLLKQFRLFTSLDNQTLLHDQLRALLGSEWQTTSET